MENIDVIIIGGGPAGLAAAVELHRLGITDILIVEREKTLGGILRQCIHDGFGLTRFKESLSGPEYAQRFIDLVEERKIPYLIDATVTDLTGERVVSVSTRKGILEFQAKAVILTMGCRERTRGAIGIPGTRPAGVWTAGVAQAYINLHNFMVGREIVILGSGDIGLIMARRLTLEGAKVKAVFELLPYPSGLPRNIRQCLDDFDIPLRLSHTVTEIRGQARLEGVMVAEVDDRMNPVPGTETWYPCDTLILSVGLIPENELSLAAGVILDGNTRGPIVDLDYQTNVPGIFAAGNVLHVHDLVDFVSLEAEKLAASVSRYISGEDHQVSPLEIRGNETILYTIPQKAGTVRDFILSLRVRRPFRNCEIQLTQNGRLIKTVVLKKALPAEMIRITVEASALASTGPLEVAVVC